MASFTSLFDAPSIELVLPSLLYDDWIRDFLHDFQHRNRAALNATLRIDFTQCEWVSPLPLLAIATEVMSFSDAGRVIEIDLGEGASSDQGAKNRWRTLKFLSLHGFLNAFVSRRDLSVRFQFDKTGERGETGEWHEGADGLKKLRETLDRSHFELIYGDSIVLPATIWGLPASTSSDLTATIRLKVRELLKQADTALFRFKTDSRKYRDVTLQRINQVLLELVENAAEHAYTGASPGFVGIYARVRHTHSDMATAARSMELARSPLLSKVLLSEKQQQIELFVLDVGRGLFSDMSLWKNDSLHKISTTQPLRRTASVLFLKPLSRHDRTIESVAQLRGGSTGLMHLDAILRHQNDSSRIVTGNEWLAGSHPRPPGFQENSVTGGGYEEQQDRIEGTFFHLGISPAVIPELNAQWFSSERETSGATRHSIIQKFAAAKTLPKLVSRVIDIRNGEGLDSVQSRVEQTSMVFSGTIVRVNRIAEKNLVNRIVMAWVRGNAKSRRATSSLFLCDLGRYQAIDTVWVIEHLFSVKDRLDLESLPGDSKIFLVTEDLCCTELEVTCKARRDGKFQVQVGRPTANISKLDTRFVFLLV